MRVFILAAALALALNGANAALADDGNNYQAIENAMVGFISGWRDGDRDKIDEVADLDHGHAIWLRTDDGVKSVTSLSFDEMTTDMQPHPNYGVAFQVLAINIVDQALAFGTIASGQAQGGTVIDYYTLMKVEGNWTIVELSWLYRPDMQVGNEQ